MMKATLQVRHGEPHAAYGTLGKAQEVCTHKRSLLDAMYAYSCIGVGDSEGAKAACDRVLGTEPSKVRDADYIQQYCRYLRAVLANDYSDYVAQRQKLRVTPRSRFTEEALRVDPLYVPAPSTSAIN